ncbi:MAG TPA: hypothetical protein VKN99_04245 [Polyangia bacterium]|nr:hypothetical protein [Polyangia bacterium]
MRRLLGSALWVSIAGCSVGLATWPPDGGAGRGGGTGGTGGTGGAGGACGPSLPAVDPASLPTCCTVGAAHCVPSSVIPAGVAGLLATCPGGSCVPDAFIRTGGAYTPPSCQSIGGPGVCLSLCIPQVMANQGLLPQASCAPDERCAPCINPLDNKPTGACELGKCSGGGGGSGGTSGSDGGAAPMCPHMGPPVIDPNTLPACCSAGGSHCVSAQLVPPAVASLLAMCPNGGGYCAPDPFIAAAGQYIPPTCNSLENAEGRCMSVCIPQVAAQQQLLPQSTCAASEKCVPCYSPLDGTPTGACRLSCDPGPTRPPVQFASCCSNQARCVPQSAIPQALQANLEQKECAAAHLCVPSENLQPNFTPPACTASSFLLGNYSGVCLSKCLHFGIQRIALDQGSCDDNHLCAPCRDPSGQPTGAPGCPP